MASVITLKAIDRAIANLSFRDENVLPYRLVTAIRQFYHDGYSIESLEAIKSDDLIKVLWNTGDDPEEISKKRNNLSSIKSSVNAKLRELYREQRNPDGIIIGSTNIFVMCDEAKDTILKAFLKHFTTKGTATVEQISDILRAVDELLSNKGIVRNKLKIKATIQNARSFLAVQKEFGSFDSYIWRFVCGETIKNKWKTMEEIPSQTKESATMSADLKKRGFTFVGPTICYAFMQAAGLVNDHVVDCFRYEEV